MVGQLAGFRNLAAHGQPVGRGQCFYDAEHALVFPLPRPVDCRAVHQISSQGTAGDRQCNLLIVVADGRGEHPAGQDQIPTNPHLALGALTDRNRDGLPRPAPGDAQVEVAGLAFQPR